MKNRGFEAALFFGAVGAFWRRWFDGAGRRAEWIAGAMNFGLLYLCI